MHRLTTGGPEVAGAARDLAAVAGHLAAAGEVAAVASPGQSR